jgi:hypothetical protein
MKNNFDKLAWYYIKNLVLMKISGRLYGRFLGRKSDAWQRLYESIKGHDTWLVVGNGPSLRVSDLEAFQAIGIPSIASNKINLLFSRTDWRPTLYTIADPLLLHKLPAKHYRTTGLSLMPHTHVFMAKTRNVLPWRHLLNHEGEQKYSSAEVAATPLSGFFVGGTISCPNLQLAIWAGAKTVYLIGCDHFYANEESTTSSKKSGHGGVSNHFDPDYRKPGEIVNEAPVEVMNRGYALIQKIAEKRGVRIVNISRQTALGVFVRDTVDNAIAMSSRRDWAAQARSQTLSADRS